MESLFEPSTQLLILIVIGGGFIFLIARILWKLGNKLSEAPPQPTCSHLLPHGASAVLFGENGLGRCQLCNLVFVKDDQAWRPAENVVHVAHQQSARDVVR